MSLEIPNEDYKRKMSKDIKKWLYRIDLLALFVFLDLPGGSDGKTSACKLETWVWSLGWEDPLEEGMATHSSILAWRIPWTEEPGKLQSMGSQRVGHVWMIKHSTE